VLAGLPEDVRQMIRLHYFQGLGHAECAARLGLTRDSFNMKLFRARQALRQTLAQFDFTDDTLRALGALLDDATDAGRETLEAR